SPIRATAPDAPFEGGGRPRSRAMPIRITCPHCRDSYSVDEDLLGKRVRCRECKEAFTVQSPRRREDDEDEGDRRPDRRVGARPSRAVEYEAPRRSSRSRDEDDPPPRRKTKSGGLSPLVLVGGGVGVLLLVALAVAGSFWLGRQSNAPDQANTNPGGAS